MSDEFPTEENVHDFVISGLKAMVVSPFKFDFLSKYGFTGKNRAVLCGFVGDPDLKKYQFDHTALAKVLVLNQERCRITHEHLEKLKQWNEFLSELNMQQIETYLNDQGFFSE